MPLVAQMMGQSKVQPPVLGPEEKSVYSDYPGFGKYIDEVMAEVDNDYVKQVTKDLLRDESPEAKMALEALLNVLKLNKE